MLRHETWKKRRPSERKNYWHENVTFLLHLIWNIMKILTWYSTVHCKDAHIWFNRLMPGNGHNSHNRNAKHTAVCWFDENINILRFDASEIRMEPLLCIYTYRRMCVWVCCACMWMGKSNLMCVSWYADCGCNNLINFEHNIIYYF